MNDNIRYILSKKDEKWINLYGDLILKSLLSSSKQSYQESPEGFAEWKFFSENPDFINKIFQISHDSDSNPHDKESFISLMKDLKDNIEGEQYCLIVESFEKYEQYLIY